MSPALRERVVDRPAWGEDLHRLFGRSKIVLNITRSDFFGTETGVNLRIFEALAAGRFLLTDHCDEIAELFRPGVDIETYRSAAELAEKVDYYLGNDEKRLAIARNGHETFLKAHTWNTRIGEMMPLLENTRDAAADHAGPIEAARLPDPRHRRVLRQPGAH